MGGKRDRLRITTTVVANLKPTNTTPKGTTTKNSTVSTRDLCLATIHHHRHRHAPHRLLLLGIYRAAEDYVLVGVNKVI